MPFEENEVSIKSQGGTEITKRGIASRMPDGLADDFQIICSRLRNLEEDKIRIYWLHDLPEDPELSHLKTRESRDRFHKFVFSSNWQYSRFQYLLNFPYDEKSIVIETPIEVLPKVEKKFDTIRLVYSSTPQRGLHLLVPVFEELAKKYDNIHLDVFSSFKIYGWEDTDKQFEPLYDKIRNHPQMTYHGFAPNETVRETLLNAHIHAYPNVWLETSCRSVIEAMSAGLLCVHPNFGALSDTSGGLTFQYQGNTDQNKHANIFYQALDTAIKNVSKEEVQTHLALTKMYADNRFGFERITKQWEDLLVSLKMRYPEAESRKIPAPVFEYNTA